MATTYGISFELVLNSSRFLHVTEGLVMDIIHDILEGVLQYEVKELLKYLVSENICSLELINRKIAMFPYGYSDILNKPSEISREHLSSSDHKLRQNGMKKLITVYFNYPISISFSDVVLSTLIA